MSAYRLIAGVLLLASPLLCSAEQHPACEHPFGLHAERSPAELRLIAASCRRDAVADLFLRRAYHAELVDEGETLSGLIPYRSIDREVDVVAFRLYMALVEALAPVWFPAHDARLTFLNEEYARHNEIVELRLHGHNRLADRLEEAP